MKKILLTTLIILFNFKVNGQVIFNENFDGTIATLINQGWNAVNLSSPVGNSNWHKGQQAVFSSYSGNPDSYMGASYFAVNNLGTISAWLFTPVINLKNGDLITFYSRDHHDDFADRLEVRISSNGENTLLPSGSSTSIGDFSNLLLTINPNLTLTGYPSVWTLYTIEVTGLSSPTNCRLAFRYYVTDAGANGTNADYIGIDSLTITSANLSNADFERTRKVIFPNPCVNEFTLDNFDSYVDIEIYDFTGKKLSLKKISNHSFDVSSLITGTYLVRITDINNEVEILKLIKQ